MATELWRNVALSPAKSKWKLYMCLLKTCTCNNMSTTYKAMNPRKQKKIWVLVRCQREMPQDQWVRKWKTQSEWRCTASKSRIFTARYSNEAGWCEPHKSEDVELVSENSFVDVREKLKPWLYTKKNHMHNHGHRLSSMSTCLAHNFAVHSCLSITEDSQKTQLGKMVMIGKHSAAAEPDM